MSNLPNITFDSFEDDGRNAAPKVQKVKFGFDEKNYLNTRVDEGSGTRETTVRILPIDGETPQDGKSVKFAKHIFVHNIKLPDGKYKSYICLEKTEGLDEKYGHKCPFCELNREAYKKADELPKDSKDPAIVAKRKSLIDVSIANKATQASIFRVIERGKEHEGPKFWKFNHRQDETDPYHRLRKLFLTRKAEAEEVGQVVNILDLYQGKDLVVTFSEGTTAPTITDKSFCTPLSKDADEMARWVTDGKKWSDVFGVKPYEYLQLILNGEEPWYDKNRGVWVSKTEFETNRNKINENANQEIANAEAQFKGTTPVTTVQTPQPVQSSVTLPQSKPVHLTAQAPESNIMDAIMLNDDEEDLPF